MKIIQLGETVTIVLKKVSTVAKDPKYPNVVRVYGQGMSETGISYQCYSEEERDKLYDQIVEALKEPI